MNCQTTLCLALGMFVTACALPSKPGAVALVSDPADPTAPATSMEPTVPREQGNPQLQSCEIERVWWQPIESHTVGPSLFEESPNRAMLLRSNAWDANGSIAFRISDGEQMMQVPWIPASSMDAGWHYRAEAVQNPPSVRVTSLVAGNLIFERALPELPEGSFTDSVYASLTSDGSRIAALHCRSDAGVHSGRLTSWDVVDGTQGAEITLEGNCGFWGDPKPPVLVPLDRDRVIMALPTRPGLTVVHLVTGEVQHGALEIDSDENDFFYPHGNYPIMDLALSPDGESAITSSNDGAVRFWSLSDLSVHSQSVESGVAPINQVTYMPGQVSPVAWSAGGELAAHLNADNQVVILRTADLSVLKQLETPALEDSGPGQYNSPIDLLFLEDGSGIAVSFERGVALWRCKGSAAPQPTKTLKVILEADDAAAVGVTTELVATHLGGDHLHSHQLLVDGEPVAAPAMERTFQWTPEAAGDYELTVIVDDGTNVGTAVIHLSIAP